MQLTDVQILSSDYTNNDVNEMAAVMQSTHLSSPAAEIRWTKVNRSDAQAWMRTTVATSLQEEYQIQRMSTGLVIGDRGVPASECAEHLIIRDLDMKHMEEAGVKETPGRVVAHADWRYTPAFSGDIADTPSEVNRTGSHPAGFNKDLDAMLNHGIESSIKTHFDRLPFFYLLGISTLTPSHIRKGIAKKLVQWIDPYVDHYSIPVVLYASPLGLHLYRNCGYLEYRDLDVSIDLEKWGVKEMHRHVVMIRWPKDESRLSEEWKHWRKSHQEGQSPTTTSR